LCGWVAHGTRTQVPRRRTGKPSEAVRGDSRRRKVLDKIKVIDRLLEKADTILIGGAMAYTFKLAQGLKVGKSLVETDRTDVATAALNKAKERGVQFLLPSDNVIAIPVDTGKVNKKGKPVFELKDARVNILPNIPDEAEGFDIGPKPRSATPKSFVARRRFCGTARWACSRTNDSPKGPWPSRALWWKRRRRTKRRASSAAATV
jgi:hypothetical protein